MTDFQSSVVRQGNFAAVTVVIDGEALIADSTHPNFNAIVEQVTAGNSEGLVDMFDVQRAINRRFASLGKRVTVKDGVVYFDGDEVDNALSRQILKFLAEDNAGLGSLVRFFDKVMANPQPHSREQLYGWIQDRHLTITDSGNIIAYKGVNLMTGDEDGVFRSSGSGKAVVDDVEHEGQIPQSVGSVVTMPRSAVQHDPRQGCHTGLHAGTYGYASTFTNGPTLTVEIDPRDVVSVPTDCDAQKMRVCRYTVTGVVTSALDARVVRDYVPSHANTDDLGY